MKTLRWMVLMAVFIFLPTLSYPATLGSLRVSLIEGDVQINTEDTGDWVPASINMPLKDGDRIWVPEGGRAELQLRDGTALRLDEKTALDILSLCQPPNPIRPITKRRGIPLSRIPLMSGIQRAEQKTHNPKSTIRNPKFH